MLNETRRSSWPKMPLPAGTLLMSALTVTLVPAFQYVRRAPVDLGTADPVPRALLGRLGDDVEVLLDRRAVGHRHVEPHDHRHPDPDGLAGQRRDRRVGLLVEGQRCGPEVGGPLDALPPSIEAWLTTVYDVPARAARRPSRTSGRPTACPAPARTSSVTLTALSVPESAVTEIAGRRGRRWRPSPRWCARRASATWALRVLGLQDVLETAGCRGRRQRHRCRSRQRSATRPSGPRRASAGGRG